jgi:hypothetical protein
MKHCIILRSIRAEVESQLEKKIKRVCVLIVEDNISQMSSLIFVRSTV